MIQYDVYKDSELEWIEKIPNHWTKGRLGYYAMVFRGSGYQYLNHVEDDFNGRKEKVIRISDITEFNPIWCEYLGQFENYRIKKNNILVGGTGHYFGKSIFVTEEMEGLVHSYNIIRLVISSQCSKFIQYYISSNFIREQMDISVLGSGQPFIDIQGLKDLQLIIPPLQEQQIIVQFLDKKTSLIDKLIEKTQRKIELLKENRTALINYTITKGLNPDVEMVNSGVEWIGEIPSHYTLLPLKFLVRENELSLGNDTPPNYELYYIEISDVNSLGEIKNTTHYLFKDSPSRCRRIVRKGDVIVSTVRTYLKSIGIIDFDVKDLICSTGFSVLTPNENCLPKYLFYLLRTEWFISNVISLSTGVSYPSIQSDKLLNIIVIYPELNEQQQIVQFLDEKTSTIDNTIKLEEIRINMLKEYRQSLISEVVTGKIKVTTDE